MNQQAHLPHQNGVQTSWRSCILSFQHVCDRLQKTEELCRQSRASLHKFVRLFPVLTRTVEIIVGLEEKHVSSNRYVNLGRAHPYQCTFCNPVHVRFPLLLIWISRLFAWSSATTTKSLLALTVSESAPTSHCTTCTVRQLLKNLERSQTVFSTLFSPVACTEPLQ